LLDGGGWKFLIVIFKIFLVPRNFEMEREKMLRKPTGKALYKSIPKTPS
jgi:hypothetical protein